MKMTSRAQLFAIGVVLWTALIPVAILNGLFRETLIAPAVGAQADHVISTLMFSVVVFAAAYILMHRWGHAAGRGQALGIGLTWMMLTILFEFVFGHYVLGHSWERLLGDYNLAAGRIWILVLLSELIAPLLMHRGAGLRAKSTSSSF